MRVCYCTNDAMEKVQHLRNLRKNGIKMTNKNTYLVTKPCRYVHVVAPIECHTLLLSRSRLTISVQLIRRALYQCIYSHKL